MLFLRFQITEHCNLLIWANVPGQHRTFIISNFRKIILFKSSIPHITMELFVCCFCNLWTWATFRTKLQTRSCYTNRLMEKQLCGHREYVLYIVLLKTEILWCKGTQTSQESNMFWLIANAAVLFVWFAALGKNNNNFVFSFIFAYYFEVFFLHIQQQMDLLIAFTYQYFYIIFTLHLHLYSA